MSSGTVRQPQPPGGNFGFLATVWPGVARDCAAAEQHLANDPRAACIYARRAIEELMDELYGVLGLPGAFNTELAALVNAPQFRQQVPQGITAKLNLIRKVGNAAVHEGHPVQPATALQVLRDLHSVTLWAAFHHSAARADIPTAVAFNPELAKRAAPIPRAQVAQLARKWEAERQQHGERLAASEQARAELEQQLAELRAQLAAAQAESAAVPDLQDYDEAATRSALIDLLLAEAGWPLNQKRDREFPVVLPDGSQGRADYVLWGDDGLPLAVVEAKRASRDAEQGRAQAEQYADALQAMFGQRPIIYYTNGIDTWLWDDAAFGNRAVEPVVPVVEAAPLAPGLETLGLSPVETTSNVGYSSPGSGSFESRHFVAPQPPASGYPPRQVQGFGTRNELALLVQRRTARKPLAVVVPNSDIAGRPYQLEAIAAVGDFFERRRRRALLVMATGTGKTRTAVALVDQLTRAGWVKNVLFLADRKELVKQATNAFKTHLPSSNPVNLLDEPGGQGRVYLSTYPTMMNLVERGAAGEGRWFGPEFFDLVIIDEAHRSIFAKYSFLWLWFDALLVGLTATPVDQIHRSTYQVFGLEAGVPTAAYSLEQAVADGYLVPPTGLDLSTKFLRSGVKYADLTAEEQEAWDAADWGGGDPPGAVGAAEINEYLFNRATVELMLAELMAKGRRVAGGDRLGKTIVFARNVRHARLIEEVFNQNYPEYGGGFARVIVAEDSAADTLLDRFKDPDREPVVAISVSMLDTGIDVPEVVNLVMFKTINSPTMFWQMVGRGTRLAPELYGPGADKRDFVILDFGGNLEYFSQELPAPPQARSRSLTERLIDARLALLAASPVVEAAPTAPGLETTSTVIPVVEGDGLSHRGLETTSTTTRSAHPVVEGDGVSHRGLETTSTAIPVVEGDGVSHRGLETTATAIPVVEGDGVSHRGLETTTRAAHARWLQHHFASINPDNVVARPHRAALENLADRGFWDALTVADAERVSALAALPSQALDNDVEAKRFDLLLLACELGAINGEPAARQQRAVQQLAQNLLTKTRIPDVAAQAELLEQVAGGEWWEGVTDSMLEQARVALRGLARFADRDRRARVFLDLEDELIDYGGTINLLGPAADAGAEGGGDRHGGVGHAGMPGVDWQRFERQASAYLAKHLDTVALHKLRRGRPLTETDLAELRRLLLASGAGDADVVAAAEARAAGLEAFVRSLVGLERSAVEAAFADFLDAARFDVFQIRYMRLIVDELTRNGAMEVGRLYEAPFTDHAAQGPDVIFLPADLDVIVDRIHHFAPDSPTPTPATRAAATA